jgi:hypothetical protein
MDTQKYCPAEIGALSAKCMLAANGKILRLYLFTHIDASSQSEAKVHQRLSR